jgi:DNA-binding GntR family transcriptional regulator
LSELTDRNDTTSALIRDGQSVALIHERLRTAILTGDLAPGQVAPQAGLAKQLGVGRTPLREALRLLEREGLVLAEPNRRLRIAEFSPADAEQIYVMRIGLESWAIRQTVPHLTSAAIAHLEGLLAQIEFFIRTSDIDGAWPAHAAFHAGLVEAAGHRITASVAQLLDHAERYWRAYDAHVPEEREEHRAILDAAAAGNAELAAELLVAHYAQAAKLIVATLDPSYAPQRLESMIAMAAPRAHERLR